MASAFFAFKSLNMRTASAGEACIVDMALRGLYALKHQVHSARELIQRSISDEL